MNLCSSNHFTRTVIQAENSRAQMSNSGTNEHCHFPNFLTVWIPSQSFANEYSWDEFSEQLEMSNNYRGLIKTVALYVLSVTSEQENLPVASHTEKGQSRDCSFPRKILMLSPTTSTALEVRHFNHQHCNNTEATNTHSAYEEESHAMLKRVRGREDEALKLHRNSKKKLDSL